MLVVDDDGVGLASADPYATGANSGSACAVASSNAAAARSSSAASRPRNTRSDPRGERPTMIRVLLVDDHALFRSSLRLRLEQEDGIAPVGEAGTAEQAIARARVLQPDVILIDLLLPRKSGYQAIPEILSASPESRILVVSSQTGPTPVRQALSAGAHGYVPKRAPTPS